MGDYTEVFVWGANHKGQLGLGRNTQQDFVLPRFCSFRALIVAAACGDEHSLFLSKDHEVYSMGTNHYGQLGLGNDSSSLIPQCVQALAQVRVVQVACGSAHSFALSSEGAAYSWGRGDTGALGLGTTDTQTLPRLVRIQSSAVISQVSCGARHSALVTITPESKGLVLVCGCGDSGQLGTGRRERELLPVQTASLPDVKEASCGVVHTACVTYTGAVFTMGGNSLGQLGIINKKQTAVPMHVKTLEGVFIEKVVCGHHTAALSDRGALYVWGSGPFGQFATPCKVTTLPVALQDIWAAQGFGVGLDVNQKLWSWGSNASGQLGVGDFQARATPTPIAALQGKSIKSVACGGAFVLALGRDTADSPSQSAVISPDRSFVSQTRTVEVEDYTETERLRRTVDDLREENAVLREEIERMRADFEETVETLQSQEDALQDQLHSQQLHIDDLERANAALKDQLVEVHSLLEEKTEETKTLHEEVEHLQVSCDQLHKQNGFLASDLREEAEVKDRLASVVLGQESLELRQLGASRITPELLAKAREYKQQSALLLNNSLSPRDLSPRPVEERKVAPTHKNSVSELKDKLRKMSRRPSTQTNP